MTEFLTQRLTQALTARQTRLAQELDGFLSQLAGDLSDADLERITQLAAALGLGHEALVSRIELWQELRAHEAALRAAQAALGRLDAEWQELKPRLERARRAHQKAQAELDAAERSAAELTARILSQEKTLAAAAKEIAELRRTLVASLPAADGDKRQAESRESPLDGAQGYVTIQETQGVNHAEDLASQ